MNPNSILARETRLPAQTARRQQAARADFQLPDPTTDVQDRRSSATRDRNERPATKIDRTRPEQADAELGPRSEGPRGSERSRELRQDGEARDNRAERGEGPERRSARADEVSNRDKMKQTGDGNEEFTPESDAEPSPEQPVSAEAAALELLAKAEAGATGEQAIKTPVDKAGTNDAPAAGGETSGEGAASPAQALATIQALALPAASTPAEAKPESTAAPAEPETIIGKNGAKAPQAAATQLPAQGGETADAATDRTASSPEDAASSVTAQEKSEISGKVPAEASHTAPRPTHEARTENGQGQFQSAAARVEALPPGLAALPDNARALQAQLAETRPQTGPHPHGARGPESAPTSLSALPIEIGFRALEGTKRFDIRLDPAELGRVDVSLSFDKDGEVTAKLVVDRVETLHLLQRDARTLERAFDQAGLRTSDAGVQISLSDRNAGNGGGFEAQQDRARGAGRREEADAMPSSVTEIIPQRRLRLGGVDMNI